MKRSLIAFAIVTFALPLAAQEVKAFLNGQALQPAPEILSSDPIWQACGSAWRTVEQEMASGGGSFGAELRTPAGQERALCLLRALDNVKQTRDPELNTLFIHHVVTQMMRAYGMDSLDFFSAHAGEQSARIASAVQAGLTAYGHPDAVRAFFSTRRNKLEHGATWNRGAVGLLRPLIATGRCLETICSPRINETLQIVRENLDIVELELIAVEEVRPTSASASDLAHAEEMRALARDTRAMVGKIVRGEAAVGTAGTQK